MTRRRIRPGDKKIPAEKPSHVEYGGEGTIHRNGELDVEVDICGHVVAVWFRCHPLPFKQADVDVERGLKMMEMYRDSSWPNMAIRSIVFEEAR